MALKKNQIILRDIKPNIGIENWYRKKLISMVMEMKADMNNLIAAQFRPEAKEEKAKKLAMDSAATRFKDAINFFKSLWNSRLNEFAEKASTDLIDRTVQNYDFNLGRQMRRNGLAISFSMTPFQKDQYAAVIHENVSLIHSISQRYITNVESIVFQCVTTGYDLSKLSKQLQKQYMIEKRRANNIARDQANKAHAVTEQAKRMEIGIEEAIWRHSGHGKVPRPSHVQADGKKFKVEEGLLIDGKYTLPAMEINCKCTSRSIINF